MLCFASGMLVLGVLCPRGRGACPHLAVCLSVALSRCLSRCQELSVLKAARCARSFSCRWSSRPGLEIGTRYDSKLSTKRNALSFDILERNIKKCFKIYSVNMDIEVALFIHFQSAKCTSGATLKLRNDVSFSPNPSSPSRHSDPNPKYAWLHFF
jgi:hypothetical protein